MEPVDNVLEDFVHCVAWKRINFWAERAYGGEDMHPYASLHWRMAARHEK
jgi:hypothetical protein